MNTLQVWMLIGLPALALAAAMLVRRTTVTTAIGFVVLLAGFGGMAVYDRVSAGVLGGVAALLYAAGNRGLPEGDGTVQGTTTMEKVAS